MGSSIYFREADAVLKAGIVLTKDQSDRLDHYGFTVDSDNCLECHDYDQMFNSFPDFVVNELKGLFEKNSYIEVEWEGELNRFLFLGDSVKIISPEIRWECA